MPCSAALALALRNTESGISKVVFIAPSSHIYGSPRSPRVSTRGYDERLGQYRIVDFTEIPGVPCPCGTARRAFADIPEFPATVHVTSISIDAQLHYH